MTSDTTPLNLPTHEGPAGSSEITSAEGLQAILDNLDALVYVADFDTYELCLRPADMGHHQGAQMLGGAPEWQRPLRILQQPTADQ